MQIDETVHGCPVGHRCGSPDRQVGDPGSPSQIRTTSGQPPLVAATGRAMVSVDGFWVDVCTVTNREFAHFVEATGYVTLAERPVDPDDYPGAKPEMLAPSSVVFIKPRTHVDLGNHYNWWAYVRGANWRHPRGP